VTAPNRIRVVIVDDHAMFAEGLGRMLSDDTEFMCVGLYSNVSGALAGLRNTETDLILLDVDLGSERAVDLVVAAREAGIQARILVLTAGCSGQQAIQLVRHGVAGILHKHKPVSALREAIVKVASGGVYLEEDYLAPVFRSMDRTARESETKLTEREQVLVRSVLQGLTNKEIGTRLGISEGAVKASLHQFFQNLGVRTRAQMVKVALERFRDQLQ
jgi:two-component system, NarL family, nitrate/nitrite response regulator NarL